jgi:hypothetical protein
MMKNLPPPNWSPTGNSGTWYWSENGEIKDVRVKDGKWMWVDDEIPTSSEPPKPRGGKRNWFQRLFR